MSNSNLSNEIEKKLSVLKNKSFRYIGRAGDLAWLGFGKDVIAKNYKGEERIVAQYSLHIQCPFRISCDGKKILGSGDMYEPNSSTPWTEKLDWNEIGISLYDEITLLLTQELERNIIEVADIKTNAMGDVQIYLSNDYLIEVFTSSTSEIEEWRFFETGVEKDHFVITGVGIE